MTRHWITKYALTDGVLHLDGAYAQPGGYLSKEGVWHGSWDERRHFYGPSDWHLSREAAATKAEDMRVKKLASLRKQIAKLEKLRFEP